MKEQNQQHLVDPFRKWMQSNPVCRNFDSDPQWDECGDFPLCVFGTRDNGSIYDESYSPVDVERARALAKEIRKEFPTLRVTLETVDEWVNLNVEFGPVLKGREAMTAKLEASGVREAFARADWWMASCPPGYVARDRDGELLSFEVRHPASKYGETVLFFPDGQFAHLNSAMRIYGVAPHKLAPDKLVTAMCAEIGVHQTVSTEHYDVIHADAGVQLKWDADTRTLHVTGTGRCELGTVRGNLRSKGDGLDVTAQTVERDAECRGGTQHCTKVGRNAWCVEGSQHCEQVLRDAWCDGGTQHCGDVRMFAVCDGGRQDCGTVGTHAKCQSGEQHCGIVKGDAICEGGTQHCQKAEGNALCYGGEQQHCGQVSGDARCYGGKQGCQKIEGNVLYYEGEQTVGEQEDADEGVKL